MGKSLSQGGGIFYAGDATSSFVTNPAFTTDKVSLFARSAGVNKVVADWLHTGGSVDFKATPTVSGISVSLVGHTHTKANITDFPSSMPASDVSAWAKATTKPTYTYDEVGAAATDHDHVKADITDFPTTLPASDVYSWAKAATKPSYAYSEITSPPSSLPASDVSAWAKAATKPSYTYSEVGAAAATHTHTKASITDFPTSLPASDVSAWAKAANKPSYTAAEVGAAASSHNHGRITYSGVDDYVVSAAQTQSAYYGSPADWASYLIMNHGNGANYYHQMLRLPFGGGLQSQVMVGGTLYGWRTYLDSTNYSDYAQKRVTYGTGNPSGGSAGDVYIKYTA